MTTTRVIQRTVGLDQGLQLAQLRPSVITAVFAYATAEGVQCEMDMVCVANVSDSTVEFRLYHDKNNSSFTPSTCIHIGELAARTSAELEIPIYMTEPNEGLAVETSIADTLTFTFYGRETQERAR